MPHINELIDTVGKCRGTYFTLLDLMKGYHQVKMVQGQDSLYLSSGVISVQQDAIWTDKRPSHVPEADVYLVCWMGVELCLPG